jgi:sigma-B regulation protein RsbU (phosphoserine phosphatase)
LELRRLERKLREANRRYAQELSLAGSLQQSFLAHPVPALPGWQMATAFRPARETSGDFYGIFELPAGRLGIVVGDVVDKGAAAALFMALSWTLLRTFAFQFPDDPAHALTAANARLLADTDGTRFVTVFLGSLDPDNGRLDFANAGHNPALLFRGSHGSNPERLTRTGRMLGMFPEEMWEAGRVQLEPGDTLFLYTDGVTEACASDGALYGTERMLSTLHAGLTGSAHALLGRVLEGVTAHLRGDPQPDDIALVAIRREPG